MGGTNSELVGTFAEAYTELNTAFNDLRFTSHLYLVTANRQSLGNRASINAALKNVQNAVNKLVAKGKVLASTLADPDTRQKLEKAIQAVVDSFNSIAFLFQFLLN